MSRNTDNIDATYLAGTEEEVSYLQQNARGGRRVKVKRGESWKVRFLPAQLGPNGRWYARIAKHWANMKPIICPRHTHADYGGDPEAQCPICEIAEQLHDNAAESIHNFGYKLRASAQWMTYCLVFGKSTGGPIQSVSDEEIGLVYVFDHYKSGYEELLAFVRNGATKKRPLSILDYALGNDIIITRTGKGLSMDRQDPEPVFDPNDAGFDGFIAKIEGQMKQPEVTIPSIDELQDFADKAYELAFKQPHSDRRGGKDDRRGRGYNEVDEPTDDADDVPMEEEPAAPPPRRGAAPAANGARTAARPAAAPARTVAPARTAAAPARAAAPAPARAAAPAPRAAAPAARPAAAAPAPRRAAPPPPRTATPGARGTAPAVASSVDEVEDNVAEEAVDQAPPIEETVEEVIDNETPEEAPEETEPQEEEAPAPVAARGAALGNSLKAKINAARAQERKA